MKEKIIEQTNHTRANDAVGAGTVIVTKNNQSVLIDFIPNPNTRERAFGFALRGDAIREFIIALVDAT